MTLTNLKPADELYEVRKKIKALQARESEIKEKMTDGEYDTLGDWVICQFKETVTNRFDRKKAEEELGPLDRFCTKSKSVRLTVDLAPQAQEAHQ